MYCCSAAFYVGMSIRAYLNKCDTQVELNWLYNNILFCSSNGDKWLECCKGYEFLQGKCESK